MKNFRVYFGEGEFGSETINNMILLAEFKDFDESERFICKRINEHHLPNYYIRISRGENIRWYDYGSHTKFYALETKENK